MGDILVLLIALMCADTDSMKCVMTVPSGLGKQKCTEFLNDALGRFQKLMVKKTASQEWKHSKENTECFVAAMQAA